MVSVEKVTKTINHLKTFCPSNWREGQKVFNIVDDYFNLARTVQFKYGVDCFYDDSKIEKFIEVTTNLLNVVYEEKVLNNILKELKNAKNPHTNK